MKNHKWNTEYHYHIFSINFTFSNRYGWLKNTNIHTHIELFFYVLSLSSKNIHGSISSFVADFPCKLDVHCIMMLFKHFTVWLFFSLFLQLLCHGGCWSRFECFFNSITIWLSEAFSFSRGLFNNMIQGS